MYMEDLTMRLRIENDNWNTENKEIKMVAKINLMKSSNKGKKNKVLWATTQELEKVQGQLL